MLKKIGNHWWAVGTRVQKGVRGSSPKGEEGADYLIDLKDAYGS